MPTAKQVRFHYGRCRRRFWLLLKALNDAHNVDVINYESKIDPVTKQRCNVHESVCDKVYQAKAAFDKATQRQLAGAMRDEIMSELKDVY